jgi:hypothetical protein
MASDNTERIVIFFLFFSYFNMIEQVMMHL